MGSNSDIIKRMKLDSKTPEERREILSRAGKNSVRSRRKKRDLQKCLALLMETEVPETSDYMLNLRKILQTFGIEATEDMTYGAAVSVSMLKKAIGGNVKAAEFVRDTAGMNPETMLKQETFKHQKKMDMIRLGQTDIQKADVTPLLTALENTDVEDS